MLKPEDEQELRELQAELVAAEGSPWQPRCVARAFRRRAAEAPFVLTMQGWIDLDAAESPVLLGVLPEGDGRLLERFEEALAAFGFEGTTPEACEPEELVLLGRKMVRAVWEGFSTQCELARPDGARPAGVDHGMGRWLPILACLIGQLGLTMREALDLPVAQAFALIAAHRCNEGWQVAGETYAMRDVGDGKAEMLKAEMLKGQRPEGDAT